MTSGLTNNHVIEALRTKMKQTRIDCENEREKAGQIYKEYEKERKVKEQLESEAVNLTRRIQLLEEDSERTEERLKLITAKLDEAVNSTDESERIRKMLHSRTETGDDRAVQLESKLKDAQVLLQETERKYEEVASKLGMIELDLEHAEERAESAEQKQVLLREELKNVTNNMKSLHANETRCLSREGTNEEKLRYLTDKYNQAEARAEKAELQAQRLQKLVDVREDELQGEQDRVRSLQDEMERTIADISVI